MARPRIEIDWEAFDKLCTLQCTLAEIAGFFSCSEDTIERAVKRDKHMSFADYFSQKRVGGKIALRRSQFQLAERSAAMAIWLGKQYLDQRDDRQDADKAEVNDNLIEALGGVAKEVWDESDNVSL